MHADLRTAIQPDETTRCEQVRVEPDATMAWNTLVPIPLCRCAPITRATRPPGVSSRLVRCDQPHRFGACHSSRGNVHALDASAPVRREPTIGRKTSLLHVSWLVFAGYYLGTRIGLALTFAPNPISVRWPPNAILLAAMLLVPATVVVDRCHRGGFQPPARGAAGGGAVTMVVCWFISNVTEAVIGELRAACQPGAV